MCKKGEKMVRVGLQIRFEVMNVINKNPLKSVKLPSAQELADKFGMSRRSVTMELKKLAEEGWIIGVHGVGTFTNPERLVSGLQLPSRRIIGLGIRDCRQFYYGSLFWDFLFRMGEEIIPEIGYPHCIRLSSNQPELIYNELKSLNLDAFFWGFPSPHLEPVLQRLHASGVPIVVFPQKIPTIPSVEVDYECCGRDIAEMLLAEGRKHPAWCAFDSLAELRLKSAEKVYRKAGYEIDPSFVFPRINELDSRFRSLLKQGNIPDAIYVHGDSIYLILALLKEFGIDPFDGTCRLIAGHSLVRHIPDFKGIVRTYPYQEIFRKSMEFLQMQFSGKEPDYPEKAIIQLHRIQ